jgi:transcriptional regulator GlxA family with amidase domain
VSERCLRSLFHEYYGVSPIRYLQLRRLNRVRATLRDVDPAKTNVTWVATHHGFWELGRFAAAYRELFGETPSRTLKDNGLRGD